MERKITNVRDTDVEVLAIAAAWDRRPVAENLRAIGDRLGWSSTRFYVALNALLDDPAALAAAPVLVNRLRRVRAGSVRVRVHDHQTPR